MSDNFQDFEYLKESIESSSKNIKLNWDYHIYNEIKITGDDLIIDGNGHTLDAQNNSKIFNITGNNITLKNMTFKNAFTKKSGGAILNFKGSLKIINCKFINNTSKGDGGAICNWNGFIEIKDTEFENNSSKKDGGAIFNGNDLIISDSKFYNNNSNRGLSIFNSSDSNLTLKKSDFKRDDLNLENTLTNNEIFNRGILNINPNEKETKQLVKCGFIHEISPLSKSFKYLDSLIHTTKEIHLDSDIEQKAEMDYKNGINIDVDNLVIDGNGHTIDAMGKSGIFTITANNITLKNINFKNGASDSGGIINNKCGSLKLIDCSFENSISRNGGAICNEGSIDLDNCSFENNASKNEYGGAIQNNNEMTLNNCSFKNNTSRKYGGAISNTHSLTVKNSKFISNLANVGGAINNTLKGIVNILKCDFINNYSFSQANCILNDAYVNINKCNFENSYPKNYPTMIYHRGNEDSELIIENSNFTQDLLNECLVFFENGFCNINYSKFNIKKRTNPIIHNENAVLTIKKINFNDDNDAIFNNNILKIRKDEVKKGQIIFGETGRDLTYLDEKLPENWKGFKFLDMLIHSRKKVVNLDCDITIHESEQNFYESGIEIEMDNITIDGNFHTIDANNLSRIFIISGKNVILKNIKFKNAKYYKSKFDGLENGGGAIYAMSKSEIEIDTCIFTNNSSRQSGGAICNKSKSLKIRNSVFNKNHSQDAAGAIFSKSSKLTLEKCDFIENYSNNSGAIYNHKDCLKIKKVLFKNNSHGVLTSYDSKIDIDDCKINKNTSNDFPGVILNYSGEMKIENCDFIENNGGIFNENNDLELSNCKFIKNSSNENGTCLYNDNSNINVIQCEFKGNNSLADGGAIYNKITSELSIESCKFADNSAINGAAIANMKKCKINLKNCNFENNESSDSGGGIYNWYGFVNVYNSNFQKNKAENMGGAIDNYLGFLSIDNCLFNENEVKKNGGALMNGGSLEMVKDCIFESNIALYKGGAIYTTKSSTGTMDSCKFNHNNAYGNEGTGGAIYNSSINNGDEIESMSIFNCDFNYNSSRKEGMAIFNRGFLSLKTCNFNSDSVEYIEKTIINKGDDAHLTIKNLNLGYMQKIFNYATLTNQNKDKSKYKDSIFNMN